jgi:hypothetical protein
MKDTAVITEITDSTITVIPLITGACMSCKEGCAQRGHPFAVANPNNLDVKKGTVVKIGSSPTAAIVQGILSLLVPVICAAAGYFAATPAASLLGLTVTDAFQAGTVLICLLGSCTIVFSVSRFRIRLTKPLITEVISS